MLAEFIQLPKEGESVGPYLLRQTLSSSILGSFFLATHKLKHENVLLHILPEALLRADARFEQRYRDSIAYVHLSQCHLFWPLTNCNVSFSTDFLSP